MSDQTKTTDYKELARQCRLKILEMIWRAGTSHIASNFSIIDVATVLYANLKKEDKIVWSKGWAAATIYYFLAQQGIIPKEDLDLFGKEINGEIKYLGLVETTTPGIYANSGSMGHGLPIACGMALAKKLKGEPGIVYCIMSDGEMNEGTTWESAAFARHHKLDNLAVIVDRNKWQAMGKTEDVLYINLEKAFKGFGWRTFSGLSGHNYEDIEKVLFYIRMHNEYEVVEEVIEKKPSVIIVETIKGKGVSFFEDHLLYHYRHVSPEDFLKAKAELENA